MHIKDEVKLKKEQINNIKEKILDIHNSLEVLKQQLKEMIKLKDKAKDIKKIQLEIESLNKSKAKLNIEVDKLEDELTYYAIMNGYNVTTEDIAIMLDSTTDFVTRKLKDSIEHINVKPFDASESILNFKKFNILEIQKLDRKGIFFYKEDVKKFIKEHTFNIQEEVDVEVEIKDMDINKDDALNKINRYLKSKMKRYEFHTSIDDTTADKILNNEIQLSKASTIKAFVYQAHIDKNCSKMLKQIKRIYKESLFTLDEDILREQINLVKDYKERGRDSLLYKNGAIIHDAQVKRYIENSGYTKYYFIYSNKAIALYDTSIKDYSNIEDEDTSEQLKFSHITDKGVYLRVLKSLTHADFEKEILEQLN